MFLNIPESERIFLTSSFELVLAEFKLLNESNEYSILSHSLLFGIFMHGYEISGIQITA